MELFFVCFDLFLKSVELNRLNKHILWSISVDTRCAFAADVVTDFIEGLVETYPGLQYLDGFPEVIIQFNT